MVYFVIGKNWISFSKFFAIGQIFIIVIKWPNLIFDIDQRI